MSFEKYTIDELVQQSTAIKTQVRDLRAKRKEIKDEIARRNAEASIARKVGNLSQVEKAALRKTMGSGDVVVTPGPARLEAKGN